MLTIRDQAGSIVENPSDYILALFTMKISMNPPHDLTNMKAGYPVSRSHSFFKIRRKIATVVA